jgi:DNA-binding transcriptional LysR family regulator
MSKRINWESLIGRRLKLRDLHVFFTVVQRGSMAKAAAQLGVSQPAVSELISALEHTIGVRLLDRSPQGVEPTIYGHALLKRGFAAFDELKQGIRDIEFLANPTAGEVRIGCAESVAASLLAPIVQRFVQQYPRVVIHVHRLAAPALELPELHERKLDLVLTRVVRPLANKDDDVNIESLYHDNLVVVAGMQSRWARSRKLDLAELMDEPWALTPLDCWTNIVFTEAFRMRGLEMPKISIRTFSIPLRMSLAEAGPFITIFPGSVLSLINRFSVKVLPIDLPVCPWPLAAITLKNRTLSPIVQLFIDHLRAFASSMTEEPKADKKTA